MENITHWKTTIIGIIGLLASFGVIGADQAGLVEANLPAILVGINSLLAIVLGFMARD